MKRLGIATLISLLAAWTGPAFAAVVSLSIELDLNDATYVQQQDGQIGALWRVSISPLAVANVGDMVITDVAFLNKGRLQLVNRSDPAQPNLELERLQYEFIGPLDTTTATRTTSWFELIRRGGQFLQSNPTPPVATTFTCGNCIRGFTEGDLTRKAFKFSGVRIYTTVDAVSPAGPFTEFWFFAFAGDINTKIPGAP
jgi:hypothetical protein